MRDFESNSTFDHQLDRLVDGELSPEEYRELLLRLETEPGGWRRCATAFLEAQALGQDLRLLRQEVIAPPLEVVAAQKKAARRHWTSLALAASFLVSLGLGMGLRSLWSPAIVPNESLVTQQPSPQRSPVEIAEQPPALAQSEASKAGGSRVTVNRQPLGNVTLVVDGADGKNGRIDVPVFSRDQVAEDWPSRQHTALSNEVREMLQKSGHEVHRVQRFIPFELESGQQVVVPVEEVEIVRTPQLPY